MKYSYTWIQTHIEEKLPDPSAVVELIHSHAFEVEGTEIIGDDTVMDIAVLPDRAGDCLSHYGMAREVAGLLGLTLKVPTDAPLPAMPLLLPVEVKSELCRRYIAVRIDGVTVGPSPEWLKARLESVGQRSINNIVDTTNFILLEYGQPTHAYDAAKIDGGITVRLAHEGETIITLSDETKTLTPDMLVIADYIGALGIAGVKGGKNAEITTETTSIILEIANFDPVSIRKTARALGLPTDAAKRFENNLSPVTALPAACALAALVKDIAGGEITGVNDVYPKLVEPRTLSFKIADITRLLGSSITTDSIKKVFDQYHYQYSLEVDTFTLTIPDFRADITGAHDIAEEIGRVMGYEHIDAKPLPFTLPITDDLVYQQIRAAKAWLVHDGYREVMTYTFRAKGDVYIARGPKDKSALRTNLSDGLKESYEMNRLNAPLLGLNEIKLFEIGTVFLSDHEEIHVATADKGTITERTLEAYIAEQKIVVENVSLELPEGARAFVPWSPYPFITRDIAVWVGDEAGEKKLETLVETFATAHCARPATLFDRFTKPARPQDASGAGGDDRTSVAYRLVFQAHDKTLTDKEVEDWFQVLVADIKKDPSFEIR